MTEEEKGELLIRYADYFRRAEEAEGMAEHAHDETARNSFRTVALGWRQLAAQVKQRMAKGK